MVTTSFDCSIRIFEVTNTLNFYTKSSIGRKRKLYCDSEITGLYDLNYEEKLVFSQMKDSKLDMNIFTSIL
jgi:hypothetical protein